MNRDHVLMIRVLTLIYGAGIFLLSAMSVPPGPETTLPGVLGWDKFQHFILYLGFGILLGISFLEFEIDRHAALFFAWMSGALYAVLDEVHQSFVPAREFSFFDIAADWIGIGLAVVLILIIITALECREYRKQRSH